MQKRAEAKLRKADDDKSFVLLIAASMSCLIMLDTNIVAVSLPSIVRSFHASFADSEWVISAYILPFAALLLGAGAFADLHGRKFATLIGLGIFALASLGCGLAPDANALNAARAVQGAGASLILTASLAVIYHSFHGSARAKAYAFWGTCNGIAITSGPIIGGLITDLFGWRLAFLINLPICALFFAAGIRALPESRDPNARHLDWPGIISFSSGLFFLTWALIDANALGWSNSTVLLRFATAGFLLLAFLLAEFLQQRPMVDLSLFAKRTFLGSAVAMTGYAAGAQVMIFYLPLYLQNNFGLSPLIAGLAMMPFAVPMFLTPQLTVKLAARYSGRAILGAGLAVACLGDALLGGLAIWGVSYPIFVFGMLVTGAGAGLLNGETAKAMQAAVPPQRAGLASGLGATTRFTALLMGVAGLGAMLAEITVQSFSERARALGLDSSIAIAAGRRAAAGDFSAAAAAVPRLKTSAVEAALGSFRDGFAGAALAAAIVAAVAVVLVILFIRASEPAPRIVLK